MKKNATLGNDVVPNYCAAYLINLNSFFLLKFSNALCTDLPTRLTIFLTEFPKMSCTALEVAFAVISVVFKDEFSFSFLAWATMSSVDVMMPSLTS